MTDQAPFSGRPGRLIHGAALIFILALGFLFSGAPGLAGAPGAPPDPSARLPEGDAAWEYWDLNATFTSGHRISARFMITNFGPGSQSAVVLGHVTLPDGQIVKWDNGRKKSGWALSEDRRKIDVGRSHFYLNDPAYILDIDKRNLHMNLQFSPDHGRLPGADADKRLPKGYNTQTLATAQAVTGQLWIADILEEETPLNGFVSLTHSWGSESESAGMLRRIELLSMEEGSGFEMVDLTTPDGTHFQWLALTQEGVMTFLTQDFEVALEGNAPNYRSKKFWIPETLHLTGADVTGTVTLSDVAFSQNPLKVLPQPFRFLASFKAKPRRIWAPASYELAITAGDDAPPLTKQGTGIAVFSFTNPAKKPKK